jgi:hypothetical protein
MKQNIVDISTTTTLKDLWNSFKQWFTVSDRDDVINLDKAMHIRRIRNKVRVYYSPWRWFTVRYHTVEDAGEAITHWAVQMRKDNK